jgi:peptide/nickel transport system permease protein
VKSIRELSTRKKKNIGNTNYIFYLIRRNPLSILGIFLLGLFALGAILAPIITPYDPLDSHPANTFQPPSKEHRFGTDNTGKDVYSRVIAGARIDLSIAFFSVLLMIAIGVPLGSIVGYFGGRIDEIIMRLLDTIQAFPAFILAMGIVAALGQSVRNVILVIAFVNFPSYVRIVRASMMSLKERQFAEASKCLGNPSFVIIFKHLLPNCIGPILVQASLNSGWAILTAAGLGFLGIGVRIPAPEWGAMVGVGAEYIVTGEWWMSFFPGLAIMLLVLGFNLLGDTLDDFLDPQRRL